MKLFAVDPYVDQIRVKKERKYCPILKRFDAEYFDTEKDAKLFLIARAEKRVLEAEDKLAKAKGRLKKCVKKWAT